MSTKLRWLILRPTWPLPGVRRVIQIGSVLPSTRPPHSIVELQERIIYGATMTQMTKLKKQSLTDDTFRALRNAIFAGSYLPGQRLVEEEVADQLGVSRIVVREAFSLLMSDGLATGEPNRGKTVTALSIDDIAELIPLRLLMESLAATWAARRITPSQEKDLKKHMTKFHRGFKSYAAYVEADFEIHKAIWELGGNKQTRNDA